MMMELDGLTYELCPVSRLERASVRPPPSRHSPPPLSHPTNTNTNTNTHTPTPNLNLVYATVV